MEDRRKHLFVGVAVTCITLFIPVLDFIAPAIGGAATAYINNYEFDSGYKLGARMGAEFTIGAIVLGVPLILLALGLLGVAGGDLHSILSVGAVSAMLFVGVLIVLSMWAIGFGALGGAIGGAMADE